MSGREEGFVGRHGLWDERRQEAAARLPEALRKLDSVRVVLSDLHGLPRSKSFTTEAFAEVLREGARFSSATLLCDSGGNVVPDLLAAGAGVGVAELQGSGSFVAVPDPLTFRLLTHTSRPTGWVIADEYLRSGAAHPLSSRRLLRALLAQLGERGWRHVVGLELEWYLTRRVDRDDPGEVGGFGTQGRPPAVRAVNMGHQLNLEGLTDALAPVLDPLTDALTALGVPLRTVEHESGPGQIEFTCEPMDSLDAADAVMLIRAVTKQVCHQLGYHASFMSLPVISGFTPSGWHLHQHLAPAPSGPSLFNPSGPGELLSPLGAAFLGGLLEHAVAGAVFATPTVNGYHRFDERFDFAPTRVGWSTEHRGALVRVVGGAGAGDPGTHLESRAGEPCANPYLYIGSQLSAGMDGVERGLDPGDRLLDPTDTSARSLPDDLDAALASCLQSRHYRDLLGPPLLACWDQVKSSELGRYGSWCAKHGEAHGVLSDWEQREYFPWY